MQQDESGLYDVYEQIAVPFWQTTWFMWCKLFVLLLVVIIIFLFWFYRRKKVVTLTPFEKLVLLKRRVAADEHDTFDSKLAYSFLIDTLKYLLERDKASVDLKGLSDSELMLLIKGWSHTQDYTAQDTLSLIINRAQEARFANQPQHKQQILEDLNHIILLKSSIEQSNKKK